MSSYQQLPQALTERLAAISRHVLTIGVAYLPPAKGGMTSVVKTYRKYIPGLRYITSFKAGNLLTKTGVCALAFVRAFSALAANKDIRLVHIHTAAHNSFWRKTVFVRLAQAMGRKTLLHVHASRFKDFYRESPRKEEIVRRLSQADALVVLSRSWKQWFVSIGVPAEKIQVLNNIVPFPPEPVKHDDGEPRPVHMLFLGEIGERKGVFDLLKAIAENRDQLAQKLVLRIGGNGHEEQLRSFIKDHRLEQCVEFLGWVSGDQKTRLLQWADLFVLPSYNEGLPIAILEAMSYRKAVISTPVGGIPEIVKEGSNGWLVNPGDTHALGEALKDAVSDIERLHRYGQTSYEMVQPYLPTAVFSSLADLWEGLINQK